MTTQHFYGDGCDITTTYEVGDHITYDGLYHLPEGVTFETCDTDEGDYVITGI